jgi:Fungal Zn(2)-Cys(6) binuclear cluster domain
MATQVPPALPEQGLFSVISPPQSAQKKAKAKPSGTPSNSHGRACIGCKRGKVKCDAVKPTCGYCARRNRECVYGSPFKRASCSQRSSPTEIC